MAIKKFLYMAVLFAGLVVPEDEFSTTTVSLLAPGNTVVPRTALNGEIVSENGDTTTYLVGCYMPSGQEEDYEGPCVPRVVTQGPKTFHDSIEWPGVATGNTDCKLAGTTSAHCTLETWFSESASTDGVSMETDLVGSDFPTRVPLTITGRATVTQTTPTNPGRAPTDSSTAGAERVTDRAVAGAAAAAIIAAF